MNVDKLLSDAVDAVSGESVLGHTQTRCRDLSYRLWELSMRCYKFRMDERASKAAMASDSPDEQYVNDALLSAERGVADALERLTRLHGAAGLAARGIQP